MAGGHGGTDLTFASEQQVSERDMDLPTIDRRWTGRKIRHGWCATTTTAESEHGFELNGICHIDLRRTDGQIAVLEQRDDRLDLLAVVHSAGSGKLHDRRYPAVGCRGGPAPG